MPVHPRILIADNDATNVQLLSDICNTEDLEVMVAQDGAETLKTILEDPPDLVLLDVMMPELDGFEVLQALRRRPATRHLPVILVTAVSDDDSIRQGYQLGADDYLTKPFKVVELVARIKTLLGAAAYQHVIEGGLHWQVGNHRQLLLVLEESLVQSCLPLSLVVMQVLGLDSIEQQHDGATAVRVMRRLAALLRARLRGVDSAFMMPPDLLAFVLVTTDEQGSHAVTRRLLATLRQPLVLDEEFHLDSRWAATTADDDQRGPAQLIQQCIDQLTHPA